MAGGVIMLPGKGGGGECKQARAEKGGGFVDHVRCVSLKGGDRMSADGHSNVARRKGLHFVKQTARLVEIVGGGAGGLPPTGGPQTD